MSKLKFKRIPGNSRKGNERSRMNQEGSRSFHIPCRTPERAKAPPTVLRLAQYKYQTVSISTMVPAYIQNDILVHGRVRSACIYRSDPVVQRDREVDSRQVDGRTDRQTDRCRAGWEGASGGGVTATRNSPPPPCSANRMVNEIPLPMWFRKRENNYTSLNIGLNKVWRQQLLFLTFTTQTERPSFCSGSISM